MAPSIVRRVAIGFAAAGFAALTTALPASAAVTNISFVDSSIEGWPPATLVEYSLDSSSPRQNDPCYPDAAGAPYHEQRVTLVVSETGSYRFSDARAAENIPEEYAPETTARGGGNGHADVFLAGQCLLRAGEVNNVTLQAGTEYPISLNTSTRDGTGNFAFLISGPGVAVVGGVQPGRRSSRRRLRVCRVLRCPRVTR